MLETKNNSFWICGD